MLSLWLHKDVLGKQVLCVDEVSHLAWREDYVLISLHRLDSQEHEHLVSIVVFRIFQLEL